WADNPDSVEGVASSLRRGLECAPEGDAYLFCVADQPWLREETLRDFLAGVERSGKPMGCLACGAEWGNPVWFSARYREELLSLTGDAGGKRLLRRRPEEVFVFQTGEEQLQDVDERPLPKGGKSSRIE
ncbi:MAG: NTP transferase domain-containing protein, partial [Oscillospiraceae bacterium]|nr:NTP transferase domain-containing protein [Oscillospiraceae bacterium]